MHRHSHTAFDVLVPVGFPSSHPRSKIKNTTKHACIYECCTYQINIYLNEVPIFTFFTVTF